jgi:hypothetical protein
MDSLQKLDIFLQDLQGPPTPDASMFELSMKTAFALGGGMLDEMLPDDPRDLDDMLERVARHILSMRSDDAPPVAIEGTAEEVVAAGELEAGEPQT